MQTLSSLAAQVLALARSRLMADLRFLSGSLEQLAHAPAEELPAPLATDGGTLYYCPVRLLELFKQQQDLPARALLHLTLHCLLGHPFQKQELDRPLWNLACDIAVEEIIRQLAPPSFTPEDSPARRDWRLRLAEHCPHMTSQEIYHYLTEHRPGREEAAALTTLFARDSHALWYTRSASEEPGPRFPGAPTPGEESEDPLRETETIRPQNDQTAENLLLRRRQTLRQQWKQLARKAEADLKLFSRRYGRRAGALMDGLAPITFEECDYSEFLRRFGEQNEVMQLSDDAFDLIYYTYGLKKYGNVPLIEPLEYRDDKRIREFVIAIDTSGSVQGEIVQSFLQRTCDVLRQSGSFTSRVEIYLVQCDAEIQSVQRLTDLDQLHELIPQLKLRGFGGTDFRPVFEYVDQLLETRRLTRLNGLLYFTDGAGAYPEKVPAYKTAFIFNRDDCLSPEVPPWAIRAVLTTDNIRLLKEEP